mmetsp:Transcript_22125/g.44377  ORF Transcript_22125/g.44377 Transcript_22125/m.44377 type:complete len:85 (-) Transcript_22125:135-389(-)
MEEADEEGERSGGEGGGGSGWFPSAAERTSKQKAAMSGVASKSGSLAEDIVPRRMEKGRVAPPSATDFGNGSKFRDTGINHTPL